jgi:alanyl-tRNA synthetase
LRAVRAARVDATILREAAALLSSGAPDLPTAVARLLTDSKAAAKERQKLREELAGFQGAAMVAEVPVNNGLRLVSRIWNDRDRDYVKLLASRTAAAAPATAVIFCAEEGGSARVFVARSKDLRFDCGQILREALSNLGLRGGGSADLAQGEVPAGQEPALRALLTDAICKAVADQQNPK